MGAVCALLQVTNLELGFPAHVTHVITPDSYLYNTSLLEMDTRMMEVSTSYFCWFLRVKSAIFLLIPVGQERNFLIGFSGSGAQFFKMIFGGLGALFFFPLETCESGVPI